MCACFLSIIALTEYRTNGSTNVIISIMRSSESRQKWQFNSTSCHIRQEVSALVECCPFLAVTCHTICSHVTWNSCHCIGFATIYLSISVEWFVCSGKSYQCLNTSLSLGIQIYTYWWCIIFKKMNLRLQVTSSMHNDTNNWLIVTSCILVICGLSQNWCVCFVFRHLT